MQEMKAIDSENFVIFGGDTNLRDAEMVRVARLDGIHVSYYVYISFCYLHFVIEMLFY